jgi:hypothetical protein
MTRESDLNATTMDINHRQVGPFKATMPAAFLPKDAKATVTSPILTIEGQLFAEQHSLLR